MVSKKSPYSTQSKYKVSKSGTIKYGGKSKKVPFTATAGKQHGKSNKVYDTREKAMTPGKRVSENGNVYFETRKNRSDKRGSLV